MTTAPPAKLKAFLDELKSNLVDNEESKDFHTYYSALLKLEILQRGVLTTDDKILETIKFIAGKPLLEISSGLPLPLLAGSAAVAARLAEKCFSSTLQQPNMRHSFAATDLTEVMKRCRQVPDDRFTILLQIIQNLQSNASEIPSYLLFIAEGYYYRATQFQPDVAPLWKRSWDVIVQRYQHKFTTPPLMRNLSTPWDAVFALQNLVRIAHSKGNVARATELNLKLAEAILDTKETTSPTNSDSLPASPLNMLLQQFIVPYRSIHPLTVAEAAKMTADALKDLAVNAADQSRHALINLRLELLKEESHIEQMAIDQQKAAFNRSDGKSLPSIEKFRENAVVQYFTTMSQRSDGIDTYAIQVRDAYLQASIGESQIEDADSFQGRRQSCWVLSNMVLPRLKLRAHALANNLAWVDASNFIRPILQFVVHRSKALKLSLYLEQMREEERDLLENVASLCPVAEWMSVDQEGGAFDNTVLSMGRDILFHFYSQSRSEIDKKNQGAEVSSTVTTQEKRLKSLEICLSSSNVLLALRGAVSMVNIPDVRASIVSRLAQANDEPYEIELETGLRVLDFLLAWDGLMSDPWTSCDLPEARSLVRRAHVGLERCGRRVNMIEECLLGLGEADAEGYAFSGGILHVAESCYDRVLAQAKELTNVALKEIVAAKCLAGQAKIRINDPNESAENLAREALLKVTSVSDVHNGCDIYLWRNESLGSLKLSIRCLTSSLRQILADILINKGAVDAAERLLEKAVIEAPYDPGVAFILGAFQMRLAISKGGGTDEMMRVAQKQLLKAAKLDPSKAAPFALLGYWYERRLDRNRAIGCYSKSLHLDPCNPVAGRGILRLAKFETLDSVLVQAISQGNSSAGWAWKATAWQKSMIAGKDDLAIISYLKALRCQDIERPEREQLGIFFTDPMDLARPDFGEAAEILADLGICYRRLGRYTASLRSLLLSIEKSQETTSAKVYCYCGQVELELGLFEDAERHFECAIDVVGSLELISWAIHGQCAARLALAQSDLISGKAGSAFHLIKSALDQCQARTGELSSATHKLIGDLYTFGAKLPNDLFCVDDEEGSYEAQLGFIAKGEVAYHEAARAISETDTDDSKLIRAMLVSDAGINILLRAQLIASTKTRGVENFNMSSATNEYFGQAANEFRRALSLCPSYALAWCGLGCCVVKSDPLLAQHAFCRALELDPMFGDGYSNLCFLYTTNGLLEVSAAVSDALTQVSDTPMMWINRALILESEARQRPGHDSNVLLCQASDAYRACLQVDKHPRAVIGIAINGRESWRSLPSNSLCSVLHDGSSFLKEYLGGSLSPDYLANLVKGVLISELGVRCAKNTNRKHLLANGLRDVSEALLDIQRVVEPGDRMNEQMIDLHLVERFGSLTTNNASESAASFHKDDPVRGARRILRDPSRAELWLSLAKQILKGAKIGTGEMQGARKATSKALLIYSQQLRQIFQDRSRSQATVNAADYSDALSLSYWLNNIVCDELKEDKPSTIDLQRALLLCPSNNIARIAIREIHHL